MIQRESLVLSPYLALYDIVIPKDHELRQLKELVDFSFVDDMLCGTYTLDNGRPGYRPQVMFRYLMLKRMYELSDRDVVSRAMTDMAFKYFLGIAPEDDVIDPSSLTKFRKLRMKDDTIMDILIFPSIFNFNERPPIIQSDCLFHPVRLIPVCLSIHLERSSFAIKLYLPTFL